MSAGTEPAAHIHPAVGIALGKLGINVADLKPRRLTTELAEGASLLVTMGCGEACPIVPGLRREDWPLRDPRGLPKRQSPLGSGVKHQARVVTCPAWSDGPQARHGYKCSLFAPGEAVGGEGDGVANGWSLFDARVATAPARSGPRTDGFKLERSEWLLCWG